MSLRAAANQFGYLLGAAVGGLALELGGFTLLGLALAAMFASAAVIHLPGVARGKTAAPLPAEPRARPPLANGSATA